MLPPRAIDPRANLRGDLIFNLTRRTLPLKAHRRTGLTVGLLLLFLAFTALGLELAHLRPAACEQGGCYLIPVQGATCRVTASTVCMSA